MSVVEEYRPGRSLLQAHVNKVLPIKVTLIRGTRESKSDVSGINQASISTVIERREYGSGKEIRCSQCSIDTAV